MTCDGELTVAEFDQRVTGYLLNVGPPLIHCLAHIELPLPMDARGSWQEKVFSETCLVHTSVG